MERRLFGENFKETGKKLIPDLFTLGNLALGIFALFYLLESSYHLSISLIFIAMVLDGIDGKLAVWLHVNSEQGKQLDSLCDLVSFGVVPAAIVYTISLQAFGTLGLLAALFFPLAGAWRLARFNLMSSSEKGDFSGLPITIAGGALVSFLLQGFSTTWFVLPYIFSLSLLMVSKIRYPAMKRKSKDDITTGNLSFIFFYLGIGVFFMLILLQREWIFFLLSAYVVFGFIYGLFIASRLWKKSKALLSIQSDGDSLQSDGDLSVKK